LKHFFISPSSNFLEISTKFPVFGVKVL